MKIREQRVNDFEFARRAQENPGLAGTSAAEMEWPRGGAGRFRNVEGKGFEDARGGRADGKHPAAPDHTFADLKETAAWIVTN